MKYAWTDLETTGLNPAQGDLLEVYVRITDTDLKTLDTYHAYVDIGCPLDEIYLEKLPFFIRKMHEENGLLDDLDRAKKDGKALTRVELLDQLASFFRKHNGGDPKTLYIAGSSVKFDWAWLEAKVPLVLEEVHYRVADVSSTRVQLQSITGEDWTYPKKKGHRAERDIDETIAEYKWLWNRFAEWVVGNRIKREANSVVTAVDVWELP